MRREKLRSERAQLYFLLFLWNNGLMNTDIILIFLVSVYLMYLCFFPFHLHIVVHFYAADIHECPSVPRGRIIRYGTDRIFRTEFECVPFFMTPTKYNYFVTVLKCIFQVSVLYWSSFILSNFYFYFTTFQSIRLYFLLHYIS